ncbi:MAG TPA: ATP-binding protein [Candidatus Acidoferrales bacterium]|jgi:signal transduction histidine kinase|nr:ATP-binding protein [Candidatus Acidoferrales bacterium]
MPALRLKTKLVISITLMVVVIVASLATFYIYEVVRQRVQETRNDAKTIADMTEAAASGALQVDLADTNINLNDPAQVNRTLDDLLETDSAVNSLLESWIGTSAIISDIAITDTNGQVLSHSDQSFLGKTLERREDFSDLVNAGVWQQLKLIFGPYRVYEYRSGILRQDGTPFGEVRVGIPTTFLRAEIKTSMRKALIFSGAAILFSLLIAAVVSTLALRPLTAISRRLDLLASGQAEPKEIGLKRSDEYGVVSHKIERLGRQVRDVKEVFSALKENLDQIMANLQDGLMLFTSDFRAVLVSASAERFIGKPRGDMLGCTPTEIFSARTTLGNAILEAFETRQPVNGEEIETENGRRLQVALDFIEERGERIGALLTLRDAESVHRIEDEIELSRRLAAIGRLTSGVAHEVKNPINAIVVHLEVMRQKLKEIDPDTRRHIDVIGSEIQRLDRVVQTLVDFTRPVELRLVETDLHKLVDDVVILASPAAEQNQVHVERQGGPEPLPTRIDVDLVKQAVLNIVINGVQAMPEGGTMRLDLRREADNALLTIRDQGHGIPEEIRDKVFNLYFTTKKGGSGIGLAMAYRVVQLHHGSLEFDSVAGEGTTFYLRFPLTETTTGEQPVAAPEDSVSKA